MKKHGGKLSGFLVLSVLVIIAFLATNSIPAAQNQAARPLYTPTAGNDPVVLPSPTPIAVITRPVTPTSARRAGTDEYLQVFETVWNTIDQTFYDPDFGGVNWDAVHAEYRLLVAAAPDDATFYDLLNQMLWELKVSHTGVGPADIWPSVEPVVFKNGDIGIDVRLLDDRAVITRLEPGSPAEKAGVRPGFIIQNIEDVPVTQIIAEASKRLGPPHNDQGRRDILTRSLLGLIYGEPGKCVKLAFLDGADQLHLACIERSQRSRTGNMGGILPPAYLEFESIRLESGIGYIRFNTFHPDLIADMVAAVAALRDAPGLIIDLCGNPGGDPTTVEQLAGQFLDGQVAFGSFKFREGTMPRAVAGKNIYTSPLVILIDALSFSASEYLASNMQALGRAVIIGERSPGGLTGMNVMALPNDAILGYPVLQLVTSDGKVLEGTGVIPDIAVSLTRRLLLEGFDSQLQAAINYLVNAR